MRGLPSLFVFLLFFLLVNGVWIQAKDTIAISSTSHAQILFEEDFESFDFGSFDRALEYLNNTGWDYNWTSVSGASVASVVANSLAKDNRSLRFSGNSDAVNIVKHGVNVSSLTKELALEVVLRIDQSFSSIDSATILGIARSTYAERRNLVRFLTNLSEIADTALVFAGNGFIRVKDMTICTYSACTWYTCKVIYDMPPAHAQSISLDEKLVQERNLDNLMPSNDLCFFVLSYNQSVFLDSIRIFDPLFPNVALVLGSGEGGVTFPASQTLSLEKGSNITVWAEPYDGYFFDHWIYNNTHDLVANPLRIEIDGNLNLTSVFSRIPPFYNQSWFWSLFLTIAAFATSVCFYVGLRRKIAVLEVATRGRIRSRALSRYMQDVIYRKKKIENWEGKYDMKINTARTLEEALRKLGFTKD